MSDYGGIYADWAIHVLYSHHQRFGVAVVAKNTSAVLENPGVGSGVDSTGSGLDSGPGENAPDTGDARGGTVGMSLPTGFRRLSDVRKKAVKQTYGDLTAWIGKTIRLDAVNIQSEKDGDKTVLKGGVMKFSEFDPADPDKEVSDENLTTSQIPRGAIRVLFDALSKNPDETIICDVVQTKRGIALQ